MMIGLYLICLGILFILDNLGILRGRAWEFAWPMFLILFGGSMIIKRFGRNDSEVSKDNYRDHTR